MAMQDPSALMGGGLGGDPTAPNPDDILKQIRALLDQYLAVGQGTPVYHEASQLANAIDTTVGGTGPGMGAPMPGGPPPPGLDPNNAPPDMGMGGQMDQALTGPEPPPNTKAKTYKQANSSAMDRLKKRNAKSGSKAK